MKGIEINAQTGERYEVEIEPMSKEEIKVLKEQEIKQELLELDITINRATEDLYELTQTEPYKSTLEVIERKKELREELKKINETSIVSETEVSE